MYALSRLRTKTYVVRTKSPRAHKSYTYAISCLRAQVVLYVRIKSIYAQKSYILRKVAYRAHKPYNLRTLSLQAILTNQQDFSKKNKDSNPFFSFSCTFLHLASCVVNGKILHDLVVERHRNIQALSPQSVSKT